MYTTGSGILLFSFVYSVAMTGAALIFIPIFYNNKYSTIFEVLYDCLFSITLNINMFLVR